MTLVEAMGLACLGIVGEQLNAKLWSCWFGDYLRAGVVKKDVVQNMGVHLSLEGWGKFGGELGGIWGSEETLILEDWEAVTRPSLISKRSPGGLCLKGQCTFHGHTSVSTGWWRKDFSYHPLQFYHLRSQQLDLGAKWPLSLGGVLTTQTPLVLMDPQYVNWRTPNASQWSDFLLTSVPQKNTICILVK